MIGGSGTKPTMIIITGVGPSRVHRVECANVGGDFGVTHAILGVLSSNTDAHHGRHAGEQYIAGLPAVVRGFKEDLVEHVEITVGGGAPRKLDFEDAVSQLGLKWQQCQ